MPNVTLTIPSPTGGTFGVVIKDSSGITVFTGTESNAPFTVTGLAQGDYVAFYTNGEDTTEWCFTVPPCGCPIITDVDIIERSTPGLYDMVFTFDMNLYTPDSGCGFCLQLSTPGSGACYCFFNLFPFTSIGAGFYTYTVFIGSHAHFSYKVTISNNPSVGCLGIETAPVCSDWILVNAPACVPSSLPNPTIPGGGSISINLVAGVYTLDIVYPDCGGTCHTATWNYVEQTPSFVPPDSGAFTDTISCSPLGSSSHVIHPNYGSYDPTITQLYYDLTFIDCCGNRINNITMCPWLHVPIPLAPACSGPYYGVHGDGTAGGNQWGTSFDIIGTTCQSAVWTYTQINAAPGLTPDSGTWTDNPVGLFPAFIYHTLSPVTTTGGDPTYQFHGVTCCGLVINTIGIVSP